MTLTLTIDPAMPVHVHAIEVARKTKVTLRQLQWWDEQRVITPMQLGHRRLYHVEDVIEVALVAMLRKKGFSLQQVRQLIVKIRSHARLVAEIGGSMYVMADLKLRSLHLERDAVAACELMVLAKAPMIMVGVLRVEGV